MGRQLQRSTLTEQVIEAILDYIAENELRDGAALPPTNTMASMFDVSVPVVREAISGLAAIGLIKRQQGRESVMSTPDAGHLERLLRFRVANAAVDDRSIHEYREIVEVGNARLAARNRTPEALMALEHAFHLLESVKGEEELHNADVAFHAAVARAGGNDLSVLTLDALAPLLHRHRRRVWSGWVADGGDLDSIVAAHALILDKVRDGDVAGAASAMATHLAQARHGLEHEPASIARLKEAGTLGDAAAAV